MTFFEQKVWENILSYFDKISATFSKTLVKKWQSLHDFSKLNKRKGVALLTIKYKCATFAQAHRSYKMYLLLISFLLSHMEEVSVLPDIFFSFLNTINTSVTCLTQSNILYT